MHVLILTILVFCSASSVWAQNATTVGSLTANVTFDTLWVKATYTGDDNSNNAFALQYRASGASTWLDAYSPSPDRRSLAYDDTDNAANRYQFRAGVFGLTAGQTYDVQVTYVDADGVTGGPALSSTVTLLSSATVIRSGGTYYLDDVGVNGDGSSESPFNTFANAFAGTACGDKLIVRDGVYAAFAFSKSCTSSTWYVIEAENVNRPSISDDATKVVSVSGDFVKIAGLKIPTATCLGVKVEANKHDVWLDQIRVEDVGTKVVSVGHAAAWGCDGVQIASGTYHVYVTNGTFLCPTVTAYGLASPQYAGCCEGIRLNGVPDATGGFVYKGNHIEGSFTDAIGNTPEDPPGGMNWSDILNNTIIDQADDGIQMEGADLGLVVQGNTISSRYGNSCFAAQTVYFGPVYWIRNTCRLTASDHAGNGWKAQGLQFGFAFHNSVWHANASHSGMNGGSGSPVGTSYLVFRNNLIKAGGNPLYRVWDTGTTFDYNIYHRTTGTTVVSEWNGSTNLSISGLQGIGQEVHGMFADPLFLDIGMQINTTSPAYNAGVEIPNINNGTSAWPSQFGAPDVGAVEYSSTGGMDIGSIDGKSGRGLQLTQR